MVEYCRGTNDPLISAERQDALDNERYDRLDPEINCAEADIIAMVEALPSGDPVALKVLLDIILEQETDEFWDGEVPSPRFALLMRLINAVSPDVEFSTLRRSADRAALRPIVTKEELEEEAHARVNQVRAKREAEDRAQQEAEEGAEHRLKKLSADDRQAYEQAIKTLVSITRRMAA
ncbi:MAG TPA: hypothetical protein VIJ42_05895 [Stellaceae bacterium]